MTDFDVYERELWAGRAGAYERGFARLTAHAIGPLLDAARVGVGSRVLDLGTGPGFVSAEAVRRGATVSAVDADPQMAETAARNVPQADVRVAVLPGLPHEDESFDAVVGNFVVNHVGDPPAAIEQMHRVLRPGGRLALTCWVMPGSGVLAVVRDAMEQVGVPWPDDVPLSPFMAYGRRDAFAALVAGAFADGTAEELSWDFAFDAGEWWETGAMAGVGSNGVVLLRQGPATIAEVRRAYDRLLAPYAAGDGSVVVPAHALLACGTR
ncbi:class I SAM-dependent methyltransferase [Actinomadura sp. DC4]|uniref:class I SAM-dependent methyltransferase n=1 Tax=Actinomadura sp. DC4 TaxID=3055069 RepID=UPI0025AFD5BF|nr:class I SAM-dependent methyltransferase [Actinomadura sp. DC4]MDN3359595.1 class I SAM-dependent methyltransferase [Actinomadura sp. DC4]